MFRDRQDAGEQLAKALEKYKGKGVLVLGIPRGGVIVAYYVAKHLKAKLDVIVSRKLPYPYNPEAGFGAIAEDGSLFIFDYAKRELSGAEINRIIIEQKLEAARRVDVLRGGRALPEMQGKTVIIVDDGIAMGSTMRASIIMCKNKKAGRVVVAAPVSEPDAAEEMKVEADKVVVLEKPAFFQAVAQAYEEWHDGPDKEVIEILELWKKANPIEKG